MTKKQIKNKDFLN